MTLAFYAATLVAPGFQAPISMGDLSARYYAAVQQGAATGDGAATAVVPAAFQRCGYRIVAEYPHDTQAFTQGLFWRNGHLYESTGQYGRSRLAKLDLDSGKALKVQPLSDQHFGEGVTLWGDQIIGVTWRSGTGYRWRAKDLKPLGHFTYEGEGWGVTMVGSDLALSDGTSTLRFFDPDTMAEKRRVTVTLAGRPLKMINELETINGQIWANIWMTNAIVRMDPNNGVIDQVLDLTGLSARAEGNGYDAVLNGIAWDDQNKRLFVTGKNWSKLFQVEVTDCRPA